MKSVPRPLRAQLGLGRHPLGARHRLLALTAMIVTALLLPGVPAHADPTPAEIEAQIAKLWNEAEPLVEEYDQINEQYKKNVAQQKQLEAKIQPLELKLALVRARVGAISSEVYQAGQVGSLGVILESGTPGDLVERLTYLDALSQGQMDQVEQAVDVKRELDLQKTAIDGVVTLLAAQRKDLATRKADLDERMDQLQKLRQQAYAGDGTGTLKPVACPQEYLPTKGYQAAKFACSQIGKPYVHATYGPDSYDCVGLTMAAWSTVGVHIPFSVRGQIDAMPSVKRADLKVGDIVFYYNPPHHAAIYVGNGWVVHAPQPGDYVRMAKIDRSPVYSYGRPATG